MHRARFGCASSALSLAGLLKRGRKPLLLALGLALGAHLSLTRITSLREENRAAKPLTTQFVKRQPRLTKPLELKKRPQPKRRQVQRTMVAVKARARGDQHVARFQTGLVLSGLARPHVAFGRIAGLGPPTAEPRTVSAVVEGTKEDQQRIDMSLEMVDIGSLDTGRYHALVIQDPDDKRSVVGFCHIAVAELKGAFVGPTLPPGRFEQYVVPGLRRLAQALNEYTDIKADILGRFGLGESELFKVPWFWVGAQSTVTLSDFEVANFGKYMLSGGFVFADVHESRYTLDWRGGLTSILGCLQSALRTHGIEADLEKLPNSHPIYHCYFDFDGPPVGGDACIANIHPEAAEVIPYLEGIEVHGRLVAILSRKDYVRAWTSWGRPGERADWDPKRPFQFGINTIVFALTQEGSITHRLVESVR